MTSPQSGPLHSFWDFSLAFYGRPDVAEACIELQDRCGIDVNVLLFLLYQAYRGRALAAADVTRIEVLAAPWRDAVVAPLRSVRRALKTPVGAFLPEASVDLRAQVKRIELAAERLQQETLERIAVPAMTGTPGAERFACAEAHLQLYVAGRLEANKAGDEAAARILKSFEAFLRSETSPTA